ncbi:MAG: type restriction enzyme [Archaeoglobus sp.]|uniref:Type-2 restriction enzyme n=2 Tax=Archaeoglobus TaxID=2233 RepID=A0A117KV00_ARCFL|nr:DpnII family type II restriction endonuclease [Archaeoglobus fulgidus]KUJ94433.1 MAG: Type II restriction enzyme DpnII [Archaeoglobus fulgidus]KUK07373.1 MAG: Type II restriction enzyme DpnII [Archaeoglobus fulgidus]MDI3496660.1 type restriction enzyme [Archaeoglobus sp.]
MVRYDNLGFNSFEEYFNEFIANLLKSNKTYEYFVDWVKVKNNVKKFKRQIFLLNSLRDAADKGAIREEFKDLLVKYPEVLQVVPLLIAERVKNAKIDVLDPEIGDFIHYDFNKKKLSYEEAEKYVYFSDKVGILDLLLEVKDLYDYLLGVEVGIDTNARKNRSGEIFEKLVQIHLQKHLPDYVKVVPQDPHFSLYKTMGKTAREQAKRHDFVIYASNEPKLILEVNFYNTTGSKPISIAESYITLQGEARKYHVGFVWITDGPAWLSMKEPLMRAMQEIDYVINYKMISRFCSNLDKIIETKTLK